MNDDGDDLSEAQCAMVEALSARIWGMLRACEPEVISAVLIDVLATFLGRWGAGHTPALRRQMQDEVMAHIAQATFDMLDLRDIEGR